MSTHEPKIGYVAVGPDGYRVWLPVSYAEIVESFAESAGTSRPAHYDLSPEPLDVIESWGLGFSEGNVVKYLSRWRRKGGVEDLRKARTYLDRLIRRAETGEERP